MIGLTFCRNLFVVIMNLKNIFFVKSQILQQIDCTEIPKYIPSSPPKLQINETNVISAKCSINILG